MLTACASGGDDGEPAELSTEQAQTQLCSNLCQRQAACEFGDAAACEDNCMNTWHPVGMRSDVLLQVGECTKTQACSEFESEQPTEACFDSVSDQLPLTSATLDYCEHVSATDFRCGIWFEVEECTKTMGVWRDEVLRDAQTTCLQADCRDLSDCFIAVFDKYR
jgi:hypothetical protein